VPKSFVDLLVVHEGRTGLVVTFMALLELWRQRRIQLEQITAYQDIQVRRVNGDI
jgi:segregation and condensation protein A